MNRVALFLLILTVNYAFCVSSGDYFVYSIYDVSNPDVQELSVLVEYANSTYISYVMTWKYANGSTSEEHDEVTIEYPGLIFMPCDMHVGDEINGLVINYSYTTFDFGTVLVIVGTEIKDEISVKAEWMQFNGVLYYFVVKNETSGETLMEAKLIATNTVFPTVTVVVLSSVLIIAIVLIVIITRRVRKRVT